MGLRRMRGGCHESSPPTPNFTFFCPFSLPGVDRTPYPMGRHGHVSSGLLFGVIHRLAPVFCLFLLLWIDITAAQSTSTVLRNISTFL